MSISELYNFKALYLDYASSLISYARKFVDKDIAEDMVHDVFVKIWNSKLELKEDTAKYYLFRSVRNACLDSLKKAESHHNYLSQAVHELKLMELYYYDNAIDKLINEEQLKQIYSAIDTLPEQCRYIFIEAYEKDRSHNDIAMDLNISVRTVDNQIYKALKQIRNLLKPNKG